MILSRAMRYTIAGLIEHLPVREHAATVSAGVHWDESWGGGDGARVRGDVCSSCGQLYTGSQLLILSPRCGGILSAEPFARPWRPTCWSAEDAASSTSASGKLSLPAAPLTDGRDGVRDLHEPGTL